MAPVNVLLVSYNFPPVGGMGVQRALKLTKYLPRHGVNPVVLTNALSLGQLQDPALLNDIDPSTVIHRVGGEKLGPLYAEKGQPFSRYFLGLTNLQNIIKNGEIHAVWFDSIVNKLQHLVEHHHIDCVLTTLPKHTSSLIGHHLKTTMGIPWIADLRDSVVGAPDRQPSIVDRLRSFGLLEIEKKIDKHADCVVTVSEPIRDSFLSRHKNKRSNRFKVIENGYDPEEFTNLAEKSQTNPKLTFTYAGSFWGERKPDVLIRGFQIAAENNWISRDAVKIQIAGAYGSETREKFARLGKTLEVVQFGAIERRSALELLAQSDWLLLVTANTNRGTVSEVLTGKIFEHMALKKPTLALCPASGPLPELIENGNLGIATSASSAETVASHIAKAYQNWISEKKSWRFNRDVTDQYDRKVQVERYADLIHAVCRSCLKEKTEV
ncbi:MAG: glycosyltransferase [Pseudomonadota bacterium]